VFHHASTSALAIGSIPITVIEATIITLLMTETTIAQASTPGFHATRGRAIAIAAVTPRAEEEHLPAAW
jgi:hypothetical protein